MLKLASFITSKMVITIPVTMALGFVFGLVFEPNWLKMLILPFTFLMVYPMMINLKINKVFEGGDIKLQCLTQGLNFLVIPGVALMLSYFFFPSSPYLALGLFLASLLPTSGMTISYTGLSGGNKEAAIKMTVIGLIIGSLVASFYLDFFMGAKIQIDLMQVLKSILLIVFLPMVAGYVTQQYLMKKHGKPKFNKELGSKYGPVSTFGVIGVVFVATALKAESIFENPGLVVTIAIPLIVFYTINYALSIFLGKLFFSRSDAIAFLYGTVMRNLSIALAVIMNAFGAEGSEAALIVSLAYIIQVQSAAWFVKLTDEVFGAPAKQST